MLIKTLILAVCALPCFYLSLRGAIHIYQLEGYFSAGYTRALRARLSRLFCAKTLFPMLLYLLAGIFFPYLCFIGAGLFVLLNLPAKMKKPLVFTSRVKRLLFTSVFLTAALCATAYFPGIICFAVTLTLVILLTPFLLLVWGSVNAPLEKAISDGYIKDAARILRGMPELSVIGITGSYGKTSTKYFLHKLLSVKYRVFMTPGNFNTTLGVTRAVREGLRPYHQIFVCEMGARHLGDVREICELVHPGTGIITSVGPQHLETFGSLDNVLRGKLELFEAVREKGTAIINADSEPLKKALPSLTGNKIVVCGEGGDYAASNVVTSLSGTTFELTAPGGESFVFDTPLLGRSNVCDLTLAIACAHGFGISLSELAPAVRELKSVPHRLQLIRRGGLSIIDDAYNSNPVGARTALDTLSSFGGFRILVTPGLVELGAEQEAQNRALGEYAASRCDLAILVGETNLAALRAGLEDGGAAEDKIFAAKSLDEAFSHIYSIRADEKLALLLNDLPDNYL